MKRVKNKDEFTDIEDILLFEEEDAKTHNLENFFNEALEEYVKDRLDQNIYILKNLRRVFKHHKRKLPFKIIDEDPKTLCK